MEQGIVSQIRNLAREPANRSTIVKDQGCLPGLVLFLDNGNVGVVETALEALSLLSECHDNKTLMWNELGLVVSLNAILSNNTFAEGVRTLARSVLESITPRADPVDTWRDQNDGLMRKSRTITLAIKGLDDLHCRKLVEEQLLAVKGVVSFTFDMKLQRVEIRARVEVSAEALCAAIAKTKIMSAAQVVRTEGGQEVVLSFGRAPGSVADKENEPRNRPLKYLDDDDAPAPDVTIGAKAVARVGDAGKSNGWFGSLGNFISKSLYW